MQKIIISENVLSSIETNSQQAYYLGFYEAMWLGPEFDDVITEKIRKVTAEEIREVANRYFSRNSVISILAPQNILIFKTIFY